METHFFSAWQFLVWIPIFLPIKPEKLFRVEKKSIALFELFARLTEVWNEASATVSVKPLNSRSCRVLCISDHWGVGTCFLCLSIKTTTHSSVISVLVISLHLSDWDGWQIQRFYISRSIPAWDSSFTQAVPEMCTHSELVWPLSISTTPTLVGSQRKIWINILSA